MGRDGGGCGVELLMRVGYLGIRALEPNVVFIAQVMYGITTGIGEFSEITLSPGETQEFQKFLVMSHAAGIGKPMKADVVRASARCVSHPRSLC